jgi:integrase
LTSYFYYLLYYSLCSKQANVIKVRDKGSHRLENIIEKYSKQGFTTVASFLQTKSRRSKGTAITFSIGLRHLNNFIIKHYNKYDILSILKVIQKRKLDVYRLLNDYVSYLENIDGLSTSSMHSYMNAARSYFQYNDIIITASGFRNKVGLPSILKEKEVAIDATDIREMLNHCTNRRLKAYLLVLASSGMRATEALAMRVRDINFGNSLVDKNECATVTVRAEYAKTGDSRDVYISNEAARYVKDWIDWKYRDRTKERKYYKLLNRMQSENDLIFSTVNAINPRGIYFKMLEEFQKVLKLAGLDSRKEGGKYKRRKITFHSFRRFVKTTISNQTGNADYSEYILGHRDTYYTNKSGELERIYKEQCMKYLTFLSYDTVQTTATTFEAKLKAAERIKDEEIAKLQMEIENLKSKNAQQQTMLQRLSDIEKTVQKMQADHKNKEQHT